MIKFGAIDASMRNCGLVFGNYDVNTGACSIEDGFLIQTFRNNDKNIRASSKDYEACKEMYTKMHVFLDSFAPQIMFAEMPTGSQSANGMKSYGISLMLLGTIGVPVIQVSPQEVKVAAVDSKTASKDTMIQWAIKTYPNIKWLTRKVKGVDTYLNKNEHIADACGAVEAGMLTDQWQQLLSVLRGSQPATPVEESML